MANLRADNLCGTGGRNAITGAVYFGGDNDTGGLTIADTTDLELGSETNWTIEFWIKLNHSALSDWDVVMGKGSDDNSGSEYEWFVEVMSGDHLIFLSTTAGNPWDFNQQITPALVVGEWYHVAIVRNGSGANTLKSYVNGVQYSTHTSQNIYTGNDEFGIGHFGHTNGLNSDVTLSNVRVVKGTSVYTAAFTPPTEKLTVIPNTVLLCCNDSADATQEKTGKTITVVGNAKATKDTPPVGVDEGVTFDGPISLNTQGYMYFPTGDTSQRGGTRGIFGGSYTGSGISGPIDFIDIQSQGNSIDFGDLSVARQLSGTASSKIRGLFGGGNTPSLSDVIDFVTFSTTSNATDFGNLTVARVNVTGTSSDSRGLFAGGSTPSDSDVIDYVTIASAGNATDFGNLQTAKYGLAGCGSQTRGIFAGGYDAPLNLDVIDYVTIATTGNAADFGNLTAGRRNVRGCSSHTRGLFAGGNTGSKVNTIDYITIATTGNATDFGDTTSVTEAGGACSSLSRGVFAGGSSPSYLNIIAFVTITNTGDATDFGDLTSGRQSNNGTSNGHGGLE